MEKHQHLRRVGQEKTSEGDSVSGKSLKAWIKFSDRQCKWLAKDVWLWKQREKLVDIWGECGAWRVISF